MTTAVKVEGVSKVYQIGRSAKTLIDETGSLLGNARSLSSRQFYALKDISFEIEHGEVVGIIGRNGAGKSTLLKILSRITEPTTGKFEIVGRLGSLLEVGVGFHPNLTGRENIYLSGAIQGLKHREIQAKFSDIVAFSELEEFLDVPIRCYSSGMAVRLGFAVAIHMKQQIIILDEALAVGDTAFQRKCWQKLNDLARTGITVMFVSHNASLMSSCNRTIYLEHGQIKSIGPSEAVVATYMADVVGQESERMDRARTLSHLFGNYGDQVSLTGVELISGNDNVIKAGSPIAYRLSIEAKQSLTGLRLFARLYSETEACVACAFSQEPFRLDKGQRLRAVFTLEGHNLVPGQYSIKMTISEANNPDQELERLLIRPSFTIEASEATPEHIAWQPDWGNIVLPSKFNFLP